MGQNSGFGSNSEHNVFGSTPLLAGVKTRGTVITLDPGKQKHTPGTWDHSVKFKKEEGFNSLKKISILISASMLYLNFALS